MNRKTILIVIITLAAYWLRVQRVPRVPMLPDEAARCRALAQDGAFLTELETWLVECA